MIWKGIWGVGGHICQLSIVQVGKLRHRWRKDLAQRDTERLMAEAGL